MLIRKVETPSDFDILRTLLLEYGMHLTATVGAENICMPRYEQELAALPWPYDTLLLAFAEEHAAGCALVKPLKQDAKVCELKRLWVRPQFRGSGLGRKLTESAMAEAKRQGYTAMYLDTVPSAMPAAHRMYQGLGFEPVERYNDNPVSHVMFFRRSL